MTLVRWRPAGHLGDLARWGETLDRMFGENIPADWDSLLSTRVWAPALDIYEEDSNIVVKAEIPGLTKNDITVEFHEGTLTIRGEKTEEKEEKTKHFYRAERRYGSFQRSFSLPETADADAIKASYKNGLLELTIPKIEKKTEEARKIEVAAD
ncbi:MAG: Hsp20/alpha crystallin family protein [bacterium]